MQGNATPAPQSRCQTVATTLHRDLEPMYGIPSATVRGREHRILIVPSREGVPWINFRDR